jgi:hypothetical protein
MAVVKAYPYLLPSPERIEVTDWRQNVDGEDRPLPLLLLHWDPGMTLHVMATVAIDLEGVRSDCLLAPEDLLRLVILWNSPGTGLRGRGKYIDLKAPLSFPVTLDLIVEGQLLADRIRFEACLVLAHGNSNFTLAPQRPGSILWREEKTVILEGMASRFPTELIDFIENPYLPDDASWLLEWDAEDLNQMAYGNMRLLINAGNNRVKRAVTESNPEDEVIRDIIRFDVGRTLIFGALENDTFVQSPESYMDGSVGTYARRLIRTLFPDEENLEGVALMFQQNKSFFECELQSRLKFLLEV